MNTHSVGRHVLSFGLVALGVVGLVGCGGQTSTTAPATATATVAAATATATVAAATAPPSPLSSPVVGGICTPTPVAFDPDSIDLTGAWAGNDGGIYYVRQLDSVIWWNGMSSRNEEPTLLGREWNNVGRGEISEDLTIASEWADVPRGGAEGSGTVDFKIGANSEGNLQITKTGGTGSGRGDSLWLPCEPGFPQ